MKKIRVKSPPGFVMPPAKPATKRVIDKVYADLLDKATPAADQKMKQAGKFRSQSVDTAHRVGQRSGSA